MPITHGIDPLADTQRLNGIQLMKAISHDRGDRGADAAPFADTMRLERPVLRRAWPARVAALAFVAAAALSIACVAGI